MNHVKKVWSSTKNFVVAHKTGLAFIAGGAIVVAVTKPEVTSLNEFLKDHELYNEYHGITA